MNIASRAHPLAALMFCILLLTACGGEEPANTPPAAMPAAPAAPAMAKPVAEAPEHGAFLGAMDTEHPAWFKESFLDFQEDVDEAAANNKRVVVYVYQQGCPYCNRLVEYNFGQKDIVEKTQQNFEVIALNMWGDREVTTLDGATMIEKDFAKSIGANYTPTLLFFDEQGQVVLRVNGYYPPHNFRIALDYVAGKKEQGQTYRDYFATRHPVPATGELHAEPFFMQPPYDLTRAGTTRPLVVFFEQKECQECDRLHQKTLQYPMTRELVQQLDAVQLDMWSSTAVITPDNRKMTAREWARELNIAFAPSLVFFDTQGQEVMRADGFLKNFHVQTLFDYVAKGAYTTEPEFQRYLSHRAEQLREQGVDVDIWD